MFWLKRLKAESEDESSWALPYGDLMSLLLAVFVMIAAMSELRPGKRFDRISGAVRGAFGFAGGEAAGRAGPEEAPSFFDRLEGYGLRRLPTLPPPPVDRELFAVCDVLSRGDEVVIRIAGSASFAAHSARLTPRAERVLPRIAEFLIGGETRLEVRGHNGDGPLPDYVPFRDGLDLSYERARSVVNALVAAGVEPGRLHATAWGDNDPLVADETPAARGGANRRIEIIVQPREAARVQQIAEKAQDE